jgi:type II secretory pathway component PulF
VSTFHYSAVDQEGRPQRGTVDAPDWAAACRQLAERGLSDCRPLDAPAASAPRQMSADQAIEVASYLSALARSELPMAEGVRAAARDLPRGAVASALSVFAAELEAGRSSEAALATLGARMPDHLRRLIAAGGQSGRLPETMDAALAHERLSDDMARRLWQTMAYPTLLLALLAAWILFVAMWLIPQMQVASLVEDLDELNSWQNGGSAATYGDRLIEFSRITPVLIVGAVVGLAAWVVVTVAIGGRALLSRQIVYVPLLGTAWWYRSLTEFCGLLPIFLKQGLPLDETMRLTELAARDAAMRSVAARAAQGVQAGRSLSQCLEGDALFPPTLLNLLAWGERHAEVADALATAEQMYRDRFELQLKLIRVVLPPLVFLLVAAAALFITYGWLGSIFTAMRLLSFI